MPLFGKKRGHGTDKTKTIKKKRKLKFKRPSDVKLFYIMPIVVVIAIICIVTGGIWTFRNNAIYQSKLMASSMQYQEALPLWGGTSKGNLALGHTKLSKDGKTLAVEITYDDSAHKELSSFGNRYKLRLVDTKDNKMTHAKLSYGLFGTDGSGVLTIYNPDGFKNKSFIVMIIDNGQLVTSNDLSDSTQLSDDELDKSITSELSNPSQNSDQNNNVGQTSTRAKLPPLYYVRLNAKNTQRNYRNWDSDSQIVEDLFIDANLKKIRNTMSNLDKKIAKAKKTLKEMDSRLDENKEDNTARESKEELESSLQDLERKYESQRKRYEKLDNSKFKKNILAPKQTKYHAYTVDDINSIG